MSRQKGKVEFGCCPQGCAHLVVESFRRQIQRYLKDGKCTSWLAAAPAEIHFNLVLPGLAHAGPAIFGGDPSWLSGFVQRHFGGQFNLAFIH
jgi:hypothetical protein